MATVPAWMLEMERLESEISVKRVEKYGVGSRPTTVTVWVGGIPRALAADETALQKMLASYGDVEKITIRAKEGDYKSWCLATFKNLDALQRLQAGEIAIEPEPGHVVQPGTKAPVLLVEEADVEGELAKRDGTSQGALTMQASIHENKSARPRTMKKPKRKNQVAVESTVVAPTYPGGLGMPPRSEPPRPSLSAANT